MNGSAPSQSMRAALIFEPSTPSSARAPKLGTATTDADAPAPVPPLSPPPAPAPALAPAPAPASAAGRVRWLYPREPRLSASGRVATVPSTAWYAQQCAARLRSRYLHGMIHG